MSDDSRLRQLRRQVGVTGNNTAKSTEASSEEGASRERAAPPTKPGLPKPARARTRSGVGGGPDDTDNRGRSAAEKQANDTVVDQPPTAPLSGETDVSEVFLDDDDLLEVNTAPGTTIEQRATMPRGPAPQGPSGLRPGPTGPVQLPPPQKPATAAIETAGDRSAEASDAVTDLVAVAGSVSVPPDEQTWEDGRRFYLNEATACAERQPERAASMWIEAARLAEYAAAPVEQVMSHLDAALELCWDSPQLLPAVRRSVLRLGDLDRALRLARREIELGGSPVRRSAVMVEAAALLQHHQQDLDAALELLDQAIALQPGSVTALSISAGILLGLGRHEQLATRLGQLVESLSAPFERGLLLYALGTVQEYKLAARQAAEASYARALEADPEHLPAVIALCSSYEGTGLAADDLCRRLEHWAELARDELAEAQLLMRAGLLHLERTGELDSAARCFAGAARSPAFDRNARWRLAEVYAATDRSEELVAVLRQLLDQTLDGQGRAALLCRIGWLLHERLSDLEGAEAAYRAALEDSPGNLPAVQALGTIYRQREDYANLVAVNVAETEVADAPAARAIRYLETAEILAEKLGRADDAIDACRRALDLQPGMPLAFWQLVDLLERNERHAELAEALSTQIEVTGDDKTRHYLLLELARLQARFGALDEAIEVLGRARGSHQTRAAAIELQRLYQRARRPAELVELLLAEADDTSDPDEAQGLRLRAARLLDQTLGEPDRALEVYRGVLDRDPRCGAAQRAAGQLYHRLGRWNDLVELHRRELGDPARAAAVASIHCQIGRIQEEELGQSERAISAYRSALQADAGCAPAMVALQRLLRRAGRWEELLTVLDRYAAARTEPIARADALCRAAEIAEMHVDDLERAADFYLRARETSRETLHATSGLISVRRRQQSFGQLAEILEQLVATASSPGTAAQYRLSLARVREHQLGQAPEPETYESLLEELPGGDRLREELARIKRLTGTADLAGWLYLRGVECTDPALAVACLIEGAHLIELGAAGTLTSVAGRDGDGDGDGDGPGLSADNLELCRQAYARRPDDALALWALERAVWRQRDLPQMALLAEQEAKLETELARKTLCLSAAAAAHLEAGMSADAARVARTALAADSRCLPALRLLRRLAAAEQSWAAVADLSDQIAAASSHRGNRLEAARRAAGLWADRVGDDGRAISSLKFALATEPTDDEAFAAAEAVYRRRRDFAELSLLFEQRIKATAEGPVKRDLLRRHARLLHEQLRQPNRAISLLKELLELDPSDEQALGELAGLHLGKEHWADAATALGALIERTADDERRYQARLQLADLYFNRLHEPARARDVLGQVLEARPADIAARQQLVDLAVNDGSWAPARELLEEIAGSGDPQLRVWALSRLADVAHIGLRDQELRRKYELAALAEAAAHPAILEQLVESYWSRRQQRRLLLLGEEIVRGTARAEVVVPLRVLVARLLLEEGVDAAQALELLRESLVAAPNNDEVQLLFSQALEANGEDEQAIRGYRRLLEDTVDCVPAHQGLARLFSRLGRDDLAAAAASVLELFGAADADESVQARTLEDGAMPPGRFDLHQSFASPPELRPVAELLVPVLPYLGDVYPLPLAGAVLPPIHPAAVACQRMAAALGIGAVRVSIGDGPLALAGPGNPIPVQLGQELADAPQEARFRLWVGRALCAAVTGHELLERLGAGELQALLVALCNPRPVDVSSQRLRKQLTRSLPRRLRKQLEAGGPPPRTSPELWARHREVGLRRVDEVGLLACRSPRVTISELAHAEGLNGRLNDIPRLAQLVRYAVSDEFGAALRRLWTVSTG